MLLQLDYITSWIYTVILERIRWRKCAIDHENSLDHHRQTSTFALPMTAASQALLIMSIL